MIGPFVLFVFAIAAVGWAAERNEACPTDLLPAIDEFLSDVTRVSLIDPVEDRNERVRLYESAVKSLIQAARRFYGPFCPCSEILRDAWAIIENTERTRTPPPGWEPKPAAENLVVNASTARRTVMLKMRLSAWGWTICPFR